MASAPLDTSDEAIREKSRGRQAYRDFCMKARKKRLITVFREAMSRIASRSRRVNRADDMRHKSGRGMRCAGQKLGYGFKVCTNLHEYLRTTAIPRCALHTRYTNLLHEKYSCKSARIFTCKWVRFCAEHKKRDRHPFVVSVSFLGEPFSS